MLFLRTHPKYVLTAASLEDMAETWFCDGPLFKELHSGLVLVISRQTADLKSVRSLNSYKKVLECCTKAFFIIFA